MPDKKNPVKETFLFSKRWASPDPMPDHWDAVRVALDLEKHDPRDDEARGKLGFALVTTWKYIHSNVWEDEGEIKKVEVVRVDREGREKADGDFRAERRTARLVREINKRVKKGGAKGLIESTSADISQGSLTKEGVEEKVWKVWGAKKEGAYRILILIARLLWPPIKKEIERKKSKGKREVAYTPQLALIPVIEMGSGKAEVQDSEILNQRGVAFGKIVPTKGQTIEALTKHLKAFQHVAGHKVFRAVVRQTHENFLKGKKDPRVVVFKGGREGMCKELGLNSHKDPERVKELLEAGSAFYIKTPGEYIGGLWTYWDRRGGPGKPGFVRIVAGDPLCFEAIFTQPKNLRSCRANRYLIPELRFDPPTSGARKNDHGKVWNLSRLLVIELRALWRDLVKYGAGRIPEKRWEELAEKAGLPQASLKKVLDSWLRGDDKEAPVLIEKDGDLYRLAEPHEPEMGFIIDGAKQSDGQKWRKRKGKKRRKK